MQTTEHSIIHASKKVHEPELDHNNGNQCSDIFCRINITALQLRLSESSCCKHDLYITDIDIGVVGLIKGYMVGPM